MKLVMHPAFEKKLQEISSNEIAKELLYVKGREGYDWGYLGISDSEPDKISYLNQDRFDRYYSNGTDCWYNKMAWHYHTKPSRVIEQLFPGKFTDKQKQDFTALYRQEVTKEQVSNREVFKLVQGEDIRKYYLEDNYLKADKNNKSSLWESCMRYESCQDYLDIYVLNPKVCSLAVALHYGRVRGRAIVWHPDGPDGVHYYDRIYACSEELAEEMQAAFQGRGFKNISPKNHISIDSCHSKTIVINLSTGQGDISKYPYMDSFAWISGDKLVNKEDYFDEGYELRDTDGNYESFEKDNSYCYRCGDRYDQDDLHYVERGRYRHEYCCESCCHYSEYSEIYISNEQAVWVEDRCDWVDRDECVELIDGSWALASDTRESEEGEVFLDGDSDYVEIDGKWYHECSMLIQMDYEDNYFLKGDENYVELDGEWYPKDCHEVIEEDGIYILRSEWEKHQLILCNQH